MLLKILLRLSVSYFGDLEFIQTICFLFLMHTQTHTHTHTHTYIYIYRCFHTSLWTSGTKCLYCVSNLSNLGLKLLKKISILSQTCLGQNVSIWSQFETFLTFEIQLRLSLFESNLRHFYALSKKCQKVLKNVSKRDLVGFSGWTVFSGT